MARKPRSAKADRTAIAAWGGPWRILKSRPWLFGAMLLGAATGWLMPGHFHAITRALIGWDVAIVCYFAITGWHIAHATSQSIRRKANDLDEGRTVVLLVSISAALVSIAAIVAELGIDKNLRELEKVVHITLAVSTIALSWFFIHFTFALHYAHDYFFEYDADEDGDLDLRGGLKFPETTEPRYIDFLYYSFTIGVAAQTADVETTSHSMRLLTLLHSITAFFYNTAILALTINIAASLI